MLLELIFEKLLFCRMSDTEFISLSFKASFGRHSFSLLFIETNSLIKAK